MYKTILHATDLSEHHFDLCQKAFDIAQCFQAKLYLLHVIEIPSSLQWAQSLGFAELAKPVTDGAQVTIDSVGEALGVPQANLLVEIGTAHSVILSKINDLACDLVILGSHTEHGLPALLGSTAHSVANHAHCDVLTLKTHNA